MQTSEYEFNKFTISLITKLIGIVARNELHETDEKFWFNIYALPRSEEVANRSSDKYVRQL